jgi:hypothetical protein
MGVATAPCTDFRGPGQLLNISAKAPTVVPGKRMPVSPKSTQRPRKVRFPRNPSDRIRSMTLPGSTLRSLVCCAGVSLGLLLAPFAPASALEGFLLRTRIASSPLFPARLASSPVFPARLAAQTAPTGARFEPLRADGNGVMGLLRVVSVRVSELPLGDALRTIARAAGVSITIPADVGTGTTRVSLGETSGVPAELMLRLVRGLEVELLVSTQTQSLVLRRLVREPAPAGTILGSVVDAESGQPLAGVQIVIPENGAGTATDALGSFRIAPLPTGTYTLTLQHIGYGGARIDSVRVGSEGARVTAALRVTATPLAEIIVTPGTYGVSTERLAKPQSLSREQHETHPGIAEDQ